MGAAVIVLAGFAYLHWAPILGTRLAPAPGAAPQASAPAAAALPPQNALPSEGRGSSQGDRAESNAPEAHDSLPVADAHHRAVVPAGIQAAAQRSPLPESLSSRRAVVEPNGGAPDLRLAQRYLEGGMGARDPSEAAKLLWKAVGQQNATAAILLSQPLSSRRWRSSQLRSGPASAGGGGQARLPSGGPTVAQHGISRLPVRNSKSDGKKRKTLERRGSFGFHGLTLVLIQR